MLSRSVFSFIFIVILCLPSFAMAQLNVVATLSSLGSLVQSIGGEHVEVTVLASPKEDPHYVDARPDYILKLNKADVLIFNGMEFEVGWLPALQKGARNSKVIAGAETVIDASRYIKALEVPVGKVERSAGDIHPQGNPHYLYAAPQAMLIAPGIAERLSAIDPENAADYKKNLDNLMKRLQELNNTQKARFGALDESQRSFVSYHASMVYLADWLGLNSLTSIEPKPGVSPNPNHVAKVVSSMRNRKVRAILQESYQPTSTSEKIAQLTKASIVILNNGPQLDKNEDYISYLEKFCDTLYKALSTV